MRSQSIHNRTEHALTTVWAGFACADVAGEAMRRRVDVAERPQPQDRAGTRLGGLFVNLCQRILERLHTLLDAADRYQQLRARQRRHQTRRDDVARRLYRQLNRARPRLQRMVQDEVVRRRLQQLGATRRRPALLCRQTSEVLHLLHWRDPKGEWLLATEVIQELADELAASLSELDQALDEVDYGRKQIESALLMQRREMKRFDRESLHSARTLEAQLNLIGLPTLADAIRPHVGRMGRPLEHRPIDVHPDLVAQVLATGLIRRDASEAAVAVATDATNPRDIALEMSTRGENTGVSDVVATTSGRITGMMASEKLEHHFTELARGLEKLDHALSEPLEGLEIVEWPLPEHKIDVQKLDQPLTEPAESRVSGFRAAFEAVPTVIVPKRRRRGRPNATVRWAEGVAGSPEEQRTPAASKFGRARRVASDWWQRWRPAA